MLDGGGIGERTGAALGAAEADAFTVAAAGCEGADAAGVDALAGAGVAGVDAALSAGLALSSLLPRLNSRPTPPAMAPAVAAAAVVAIDGLGLPSEAVSALAGVGVAESDDLRPGSIPPKRPAIPPAGDGVGGLAAGAAA